MVGMLTLGELTYGDGGAGDMSYTFDATAKITVQSEMVQDEAQRTVIYQRQTITVRATIADNDSTDQQLESIKAILGEQGSGLTFINRGFGDDVLVNVPGGVRDLKWGPVPKILMWEPIGNCRACEIEWQVVIHVPHCVGTTKDTGILAFNWEADFDITRGNTTRTISGYLEIAQTRRNRRAPDCADLYRNLIKPDLPAGFERKQNHHISKDKSRLDFSVVDSQINSKFAYPAGVVVAQGKHRAQWSRNNRGATTLRNTIAMELELEPSVSQARAWQIFGQIVAKRIAKTRSQGNLPVLLDDLTAEEDIWGRSTSFSCSYRILRTAGQHLVAHSALWTPIDTDWQRWKVSMADVFHERGHAKLGILAGDAIIDLCGGASNTAASNVTSKTKGESSPTYGNAIFRNTVPPAEKSFLKYMNMIVPGRANPVQRQSFLQSPASPGEMKGSDPTAAVPLIFGKPNGTSDVIQQGGRPRYTVQIVGSAERAGYQVPRPSLESVGGQQAIEIDFKMMQEAVGNLLGVTLYKAYWIGTYVVGNGPGVVDVPANPKEGIDGNGRALA